MLTFKMYLWNCVLAASMINPLPSTDCMKLKITYLFLFGGTLISTQQFLPVFFQFFPPILKTKPNTTVTWVSFPNSFKRPFLKSCPLPDIIVFTKATKNKWHIMLTKAIMHLILQNINIHWNTMSVHTLMFKFFGLKRLSFILKVINCDVSQCSYRVLWEDRGCYQKNSILS